MSNFKSLIEELENNVREKAKSLFVLISGSNSTDGVLSLIITIAMISMVLIPILTNLKGHRESQYHRERISSL